MTLSEFRKKYAATDTTQIEGKEFKLNYSKPAKPVTFHEPTSLYEYVTQQSVGWGKVDNLPKKFQGSKEYFDKILEKLQQMLSSNNLSYSLQEISRLLHSPKTPTDPVLPYNISEVEFLLSVYNNNSYYFEGAYDLIVNGSTSKASHMSYFLGYIKGFEYFRGNEYSKRSTSEKKSLAHVRSDLNNYLGEVESEVNKFYNGMSQKSDEYSQKVDNLVNEKDTEFIERFDNTKSQNTSFNENSQKKISELEMTYEEKLKLSKPAEYWSKRSEKLRKQGWLFVVFFVIILGLVFFSLYSLLWNTPEQVFLFISGEEELSQKDKYQMIRWSIMYVTLLSFMGYGLKIIAKNMFSSFHLARDAEEREMLTYLYLSLGYEGTIGDEERKLIIQSLFSRSDSGLLKDDGGPKMPSDTIINKVVK